MGNQPTLKNVKPLTCFKRKDSKPLDYYDRKSQALDNKHKGFKAYLSGQYYIAIEYYKKSVEFDKTGEVFAYISICYRELTEHDIALVHIAEAIKLDANNDRYYQIKGSILMELTKIHRNVKFAKEAIDDYIMALNISDYEINYRNYYNARKLVYLFQQSEDLQRKKWLVKKLNRYQINFGKFLKPNLYENKGNKIPDFYTCPITLDIIKNPVCAISGTSYEKSALLEHFELTEFKDPINSTKYNPRWAWISNTGLKKSINQFYKKEPWAFKFADGDELNYFDIKFSIKD